MSSPVIPADVNSLAISWGLCVLMINSPSGYRWDMFVYANELEYVCVC